jgi:hypothetical protein
MHRVLLAVLVPAALVLVADKARAQTPIPYVPPGVQQDASDPTRGRDAVTGDTYYWDLLGSVWRNSKTGEAVGSYPPARVAGAAPGSPSDCIQHLGIGSGVTYIPPGIESSLAAPTQGRDPQTGDSFTWDSEARLWKNSRTGRPVGSFPQNANAGPAPGRLTTCIRREPQYVNIKVPERAVPTGLEQLHFEKPDYSLSHSGWFLTTRYEYSQFINWKTVSGDNAQVVAHDATTRTNGFGAFAGYKFGSFPVWAMAGGYYAGGLDTDMTFDNTHHIHGDVTDYAYGGGLRLGGGSGRVNYWAWFAAFYQTNKGKFDEFDVSNKLFQHYDRTHNSWTGEYGLGTTVWPIPHIGLDLGLSYNGQFNSLNADENVRLQIGIVMAQRDFVR